MSNTLKKLSRNEIKTILERVIKLHEKMNVRNCKNKIIDLTYISNFNKMLKPIERKTLEAANTIKEKFYIIIKKEKKPFKITFYLHCSTTVTQKQILYHGYFRINNKFVTIADLKDVVKRINSKKCIYSSIK